MSCTFATLAACFSLSGIYATGELSVADVGEPRYYWHKGHQRVDDSPESPYAFVSVGYTIEPKPWLTIKLIEVSHRSSIATGQDSGINLISAGITVRPFR